MRYFFGIKTAGHGSVPRKKLIYTSEFPYHIVARSNNREWFKGSIFEVWAILVDELTQLNQEFKFSIHAFVLMSNHYHMIASCSSEFDLGYIMRLLQTRTSNRINRLSGRINHVYGGRYKASLIQDELYYANVLKYVFRNPVKAGLCTLVEDWRFSNLESKFGEKDGEIPTTSHVFEESIGLDTNKIKIWMNVAFSSENDIRIRKGLVRTVFKLPQIKKSVRCLW